MEFEYTAKVLSTGEKVNGKKEAESESELLHALRRQGMLPLQVREVKSEQGKNSVKVLHREGMLVAKI